MNTKIIKINPLNFKSQTVKAAEILKQGGVVAFPTETVYGLGADVFNEKALQKIFIAKNRPSDNPLIVHISKKEDVFSIGYPNECAEKLMNLFWPGPLTLVMEKKPGIPRSASAGLDTIGVRLPSSPIAQALINLAGPLAAPSANLSGRPSPTEAAHVTEDLRGRIDCIIDGGSVTIGIESAVYDTITNTLLRPGSISKEILEEALGHDINISLIASRPKSPGQKYKHYAPKALTTIVYGEKSRVQEKIGSLSIDNLGIITTTGTYRNGVVIRLGKNSEEITKNLYKSLREMDNLGVNEIYIEMTKDEFNFALKDRLIKAASYNITEV